MNEQLATDCFEEVCGGVNKTQALFHIWKESYRCGTELDFLHKKPWAKTKEQAFEVSALNKGFTKKQIKAFYDCQ